MPDNDAVFAYLSTLAPSSRRVMESDLRALSELAGGADLATLGVDQGGELRARVARRWAAPSTANRVLAAWRGVVRAAWRLGLLSFDEQSRLLATITPVRGGRVARGRSLTWHQLQALLADASGPKDRALLALLAGAGLRRSEATGLTWDRWTRHDRDYFVRVLGKGNRERRLRVPAWAARAVRDWRVIGAGDGLVFPALSGRDVHRLVRAAGVRAGLGPVAPHDLRRTFYALCKQSGLDVRDIQRAMGHANISTTAKYDRRSDDEALAPLARLDTLEET